MWYVLLEILSAKVEFLPQFNVTKYGKTGIEYIQQMTYACSWNPFLLCIVKHFNRVLDFFKNG